MSFLHTPKSAIAKRNIARLKRPIINKNAHDTGLSLMLKPITIAVASIMLFSACTNDTTGQSTTTVIDLGDKKDKVTTTDSVVTVGSPANNMAIELYDIANSQLLGTGVIKPKKPADATSPTNLEKGLAAKLSIEKELLKKNRLVLTTLSAPKSGNATYYDPLLQKQVSIPQGTELMSLKSNVTPLSTLAIYRTMARLGWFFEPNNQGKLPTAADVKAFFKTKGNAVVLKHYSLSQNEVYDSLNILDLPGIASTSEIKNYATNASQTSVSLNSWLFMLAHLDVYADKVPTDQTPYFNFAKTLARDFLDGDIDGKSLTGVTGNITTLPNQSIANNDANKQSNKAIYLNQFPVLNAYEKTLQTKVSSWGNKLNIAATSNFQAFLKAFANDDLAFYPSPTISTIGAPSVGFIVGKGAVGPNNTDSRMVTLKFTDTANKENTIVITAIVTGIDPNTGNNILAWSKGTSTFTNYELDTKTGKVTFPTNDIKAASEIIAKNFDGTDSQTAKLLGQVTTYTSDSKPNTYSDYAAPLRLGNPYRGIGNKKRPFGLKATETIKTRINADETAVNVNNSQRTGTDIDNLIGKYTSSQCSLLIDTTGVVTLIVNGTSYTVFIDREINDSINRIASEPMNYMLNASSQNSDTKLRRFIQIKVDGKTQRPVSASTAIATSANSSPLANPDASCALS